MASNVDNRGGKSTEGAIRRDNSTFAQMTIDYAHHEVHAGKHFFVAQGYVMADGTVRTVWFKTGNDGSLCHMLPAVIGNGPVVFRIVEGASNAITPAVVPYNNRRASANVAAARWSTSTVAATGGTALITLRLGASGSGPFAVSVGGTASAREELILKANTLYAFEVTAGDDLEANFTLEWYEHTDKA